MIDNRDIERIICMVWCVFCIIVQIYTSDKFILGLTSITLWESLKKIVAYKNSLK